jgi:ATP-dependent helicase HrpB
VTPVLPVDSFIPRIAEALERSRAAVLIAAPGAGKTTRVPPALVDRGKVLLLQPRRVAARAMARRIASERGWTVGREIGWHIRFERRCVDDTRLVVVTEGILTAYLQQDPLLTDVTTIVIDEFHERSVHADLGLAFAKQAWLARSDLRILVMSATLDPAPVAAFFGGCPVIDVPGALHPLAIEYSPGQRVSDAVAELLPKTTGTILCFLPGAREIGAAQSECEASTRKHDAEVVPLHGSLESATQDAALASPEREARRRVILATNIAETSLTVANVFTVIDTGLQKVARYDEARGVDSLTLERVTLDSADQRAGRAARLGPGLVRRLWDPRDRLRPHREPEVRRVDLSALLLSILAWGARPDTFEWFDRPDDDRLTAAMTLLVRIGAARDGRITDVGRQLQRLPLHPRLGRVLLAARGAVEGCAACARLSEPAAADFRWIEQNLGSAARAVLGDRYRAHISDEQLRRALLEGYPDRVARRRPQTAGPQKAQTTQNEPAVTLASGHGAVIARDSGAGDAEWMVALDVTAGRKSATTQALLRLASPIEKEWLTPTRFEVIHKFDADTGTVKALEVEWYDELALREHPIAPDDDRRVDLLVDAWLAATPDEASSQLLRRLRFAGVDAAVSDLVREAARPAKRVSDIVLSEELLPWSVRQDLARSAPPTLKVPSGRDRAIDYADDGSVSVAVKLQELFGLVETPRIGPAGTPITFELLAPNGRPVQKTQDLKSFWERTYPEVRKELRGRYPKHPWPEDPWNAPATHRTKRQGSQ